MFLNKVPRNEEDMKKLHEVYKELFTKETNKTEDSLILDSSVEYKYTPYQRPFVSEKDRRNKTGIYEIFCTISKNRYIGSSVSIFDRWEAHIKDLNRNSHSSIALQRAWDKYGAISFSFSIIEECSIELLKNREQYWMDKFSKNLYNSNPYADRPPIQYGHGRSPWPKGKKRPPRTEEHKKNLSQALIGLKKNMTPEQYKERNRKAWENRRKNGTDKGYKQTNVTPEEASARVKKMWENMSEETKRLRAKKISNALFGKKHPGQGGNKGNTPWTGKRRDPEVVYKITLIKRHKAMNEKQIKLYKTLYPNSYGDLLNIVNY